MKNKKLLFLLTAILSFAMLLSACSSVDLEEESDQGSGTGTAAGGTGSDQIAEPETEPEVFDHEFYDYFKLMGSKGSPLDGEVTKYEGVIPSYIGSIDEGHDLVVLKTQELDEHNDVHDTYTVYDIAAGEKLLDCSVSYPLYEEQGKAEQLKVYFDYPVIRVERTRYEENDKGHFIPEYEFSYYLISDTSEALHTTHQPDYRRVDCKNGLVMLTLGDKTFWIDRNFEIVRTIDAVISNGYTIDSSMYMGEYQGYIYVWDESDPTELQIFNRSGMCCARYSIAHDGGLNIHILNDGNVLIQDVEMRDSAFGPYDFKMNDKYCTVKSYIMSCIDGALTEVELDYFVARVGTAYEQLCDTDVFPFELAAGKENQAFIFRYAGGHLAYELEYVCLNSSLEIEYAVKNETEGVYLPSANGIGNKYYIAPVETAGVVQYHIFDLDGKDIAILGGNQSGTVGGGCVVGKYIATETAICDLNMNIVYNFANEGYVLKHRDAVSSTIFLEKFNYETGVWDVYVFDAKTRQPVLLLDGEDQYISYGMAQRDGVYVTMDRETGVCTIQRSSDNEVLAAIRTSHNYGSIHNTESAMILIPEFQDEQIIYIIK